MAESEYMIKFSCENCGQKFSVHENNAGKKARCPKCKNIIIVPKPEISDSTQSHGVSDDSQYSAYDLSLLDIPKQNENEITSKGPGQAQEYEGQIEESHESGDERKFVWPIDILLYPASKGGLSTIAVIIFLWLLADIATIFLMCCPFGGILGIIARIVIVFLYMFWYFSVCTRDSATGGVRAPETIGYMSDLSDMFWEWFRIFACYAFTLGPVTFYRGYTYFHEIEMNTTILLSLLTYGMFFFPIGALAVIMFDSVNGLNPILLIRSIFSTFVQYCGLLLLFFVISIAFNFIFVIMRLNMFGTRIFSHKLLIYIVCNIFIIYLLLIASHILGRFYWRYKEKLNWEV